MASAFTIEGATRRIRLIRKKPAPKYGHVWHKKDRKKAASGLSGGKMQPGQCKRVRAGRSGHTIETCRLKNRNGKPVLKFTKGSYR